MIFVNILVKICDIRLPCVIHANKLDNQKGRLFYIEFSKKTTLLYKFCRMLDLPLLEIKIKEKKMQPRPHSANFFLPLVFRAQLHGFAL